MEEDKMIINVSSVYKNQPNISILYRARINDLQSDSAIKPSPRIKIIYNDASGEADDNYSESVWVKYVDSKDDI
jgi:hypothetical protein